MSMFDKISVGSLGNGQRVFDDLSEKMMFSIKAFNLSVTIPILNQPLFHD